MGHLSTVIRDGDGTAILCYNWCIPTS